MTVRDTRHAPFCWQAKPALAALRAFYDGERLKQRSTAIAVYVALTEAASNQHQQGAVAVIHLAIANATGTSRSTVKRYLSEFEAIGLIAIERRKVEGGANLPNVYFLLNLPSTHERQGATGTNGVPSADERQGAVGGPDQEETIYKNDPEEAVGITREKWGRVFGPRR
jgi:hypothetical protein